MGRVVGLTFPEKPVAAPAAKVRKPTKAELLEKAAELGIEVPKGATNARIEKLIEEA